MVVSINPTTYIFSFKSRSRTLDLLFHLQGFIEFQSNTSTPMDSQSQANEGPKVNGEPHDRERLERREVNGASAGYCILLFVLSCLFLGLF